MTILTKDWEVEADKGGFCKVTLTTMRGDRRSLLMFCTPEYFKTRQALVEGTFLIQDAFPTMTDSQREFLVTGLTDAEWDAMWAEEDTRESKADMRRAQYEIDRALGADDDEEE